MKDLVVVTAAAAAATKQDLFNLDVFFSEGDKIVARPHKVSRLAKTSHVS